MSRLSTLFFLMYLTVIAQNQAVADWVLDKVLEYPKYYSHSGANSDSNGKLTVAVASNIETGSKITQSIYENAEWRIFEPTLIDHSIDTLNIDDRGYIHALSHTTSTWFYSSNQSGAWKSEAILAANDLYTVGIRTNVNEIALAIDPNGHAHITLAASFHYEGVMASEPEFGGGSYDASIYYLTNQTGGWKGELLYQQKLNWFMFLAGMIPSIDKIGILFDKSGDVFVYFVEEGFKTEHTKIKYITNQRGHWKVRDISYAIGNYGIARDVFMTVNNQGNINVFYTSYQEKEKKYILYHAVSNPFGFWKVSPLDQSDLGIWTLSSTVDSQGYPHIVYGKYDLGDVGITIIYATKIGNDQPWANQIIATESPDVGHPSKNLNTILALDQMDQPHYFFESESSELNILNLKLLHAYPSPLN